MGDSTREACRKAAYMQLPTEGCNWFYNSHIQPLYWYKQKRQHGEEEGYYYYIFWAQIATREKSHVFQPWESSNLLVSSLFARNNSMLLILIFAKVFFYTFNVSGSIPNKSISIIKLFVMTYRQITI